MKKNNVQLAKKSLKLYLFSAILLCSQTGFLVASEKNLSSICVGILQEIAQIFRYQYSPKEQARSKTMILEDAQKLSDLNHQSIAIMLNHEAITNDFQVNVIEYKMAEIDSKMKRFKSYIESKSPEQWGLARKLIREIDTEYTQLKDTISELTEQQHDSAVVTTVEELNKQELIAPHKDEQPIQSAIDEEPQQQVASGGNTYSDEDSETFEDSTL